jgi:hypothetical protein
MSRRREHMLYVRCHHEGCKENQFYTYETLRDYRQAVKERRHANWMCIRHSDDRLLTPTKLTNSREYVNGKSKKYPELPDLFWNDSSGFAYGSAWKAFARDFPPGTKIIETVQVILPDESIKEEG